MDGTVGTIRGVARLTDGQRWHRVVRLIPELAAILACVAVVWGAVSFALWQARVAAVQSARQQTATLARAFAESTGRISADRDRELLSLRASFAEKGNAFDLAEWLRTQSSPDHMTLQIGIANRAGVVTQNSVPMNGQRIDLADREHFRVHLDPDRDAIFISQPVIGRITGRCSVQYTRKLLDHDGRFAGVGVNSVSCDDLSRFYQTVDIGDGFVMLAGLDGVIRGYGPVRPDVVGTDLNHDPGFAPALSMPDGTLTASPRWDEVPRIISFRRLEQYPLVVLVGYGDAKVYGQYWPMRDRAIEIGGAMTLIILAFGAVWI